MMTVNNSRKTQPGEETRQINKPQPAGKKKLNLSDRHQMPKNQLTIDQATGSSVYIILI